MQQLQILTEWSRVVSSKHTCAIWVSEAAVKSQGGGGQFIIFKVPRSDGLESEARYCKALS